MMLEMKKLKFLSILMLTSSIITSAFSTDLRNSYDSFVNEHQILQTFEINHQLFSESYNFEDCKIKTNELINSINDFKNSNNYDLKTADKLKNLFFTVLNNISSAVGKLRDSESNDSKSKELNYYIFYKLGDDVLNKICNAYCTAANLLYNSEEINK